MRVFFQFSQFDNEIKKRCDILFSITGDYISGFDLVVGMSRNMLLYVRDIWKEIKQSKEIIGFWIILKCNRSVLMTLRALFLFLIMQINIKLFTNFFQNYSTLV